MAAAATGSKKSLHDQLVDIISDYLGPAGERFVDRQIEFHLKKKPDKIVTKDLAQLSEWVKVSVALLTDDATTVDELVGRINKLK